MHKGVYRAKEGQADDEIIQFANPGIIAKTAPV